MMKPVPRSRTRRLFAITSTLALVVLALPGGARGDQPDLTGNVQVLVKSKGALTTEAAAAIGSHGRVSAVWPQIRAMAMTVSPARLDELKADGLVAFVEPDRQGSAPDVELAAPAAAADASKNDPLAAAAPLPAALDPITTWNLDMADVTGTGFDGRGVTVAVVDSGLPQNWADFLPAGHVDTVHAVGFGGEGWSSPQSTNPVGGIGGMTGQFPHGLAVSSVILGFPSPAGPIGGAAPGATILPIRVLNKNNSGWFSWFAAAFLYVGQLKADGILPGPVVVNFSIQARDDSAIVADAIDYATSQGVIFVTIAGNFGPDAGTISFPGRRPQSITTGAVGWLREFCEPFCQGPWFFANVPEDDPTQIYVAGFSGRESAPPPSPTAIDVLAPGSIVFGEWLFGPGFSEGHKNATSDITYFIGGTSFAAPHVVGMVAQMLQKNPGLDQAMVEEILRGSALAIPPSGPVLTPVQFVPGWDANATGAGLARGAAALAATPEASEPLP